MGFKKVAGARKYFKYVECEKGQKLVDSGLYVGPEEGRFGVNHIFRQNDGQVISLNSSGHLNWLLENHTTVGESVCNVIYDGKEVLQKGMMKGKEAHRFELEIYEPGEDSKPVSKEMPKAAKPDDTSELPDLSL
jgi:hypothetical protein